MQPGITSIDDLRRPIFHNRETLPHLHGSSNGGFNDLARRLDMNHMTLPFFNGGSQPHGAIPSMAPTRNIFQLQQNQDAMLQSLAVPRHQALHIPDIVCQNKVSRRQDELQPEFASRASSSNLLMERQLAQDVPNMPPLLESPIQHTHAIAAQNFGDGTAMPILPNINELSAAMNDPFHGNPSRPVETFPLEEARLAPKLPRDPSSNVNSHEEVSAATKSTDSNDPNSKILLNDDLPSPDITLSLKPCHSEVAHDETGISPRRRGKLVFLNNEGPNVGVSDAGNESTVRTNNLERGKLPEDYWVIFDEGSEDENGGGHKDEDDREGTNDSEATRN